MRIGVVGLGYWGSKVFSEYRQLRDDGEIDAVVACDSDPSKLAGIKGADEQFESLQDFLDAVDAIHVCTDNTMHSLIAETALDAGKDVLVEKPLTTERRSAYNLVEHASETGKILQTGHIFRFANVIRRVRELYADEYFGDVYDISLRWTHQIPPVSGTNVLWDLLPHPIDILNFITGEWPENPVGVADGYRESTLESAHVGFRLGETIGAIQVSWVDHVRRRDLVIAGSKQSARVECVNQQIEVHDVDGTEILPVDDNNTIRTEALNFIQAIHTRENTFNSAIVGARTVDSIERIEAVIRS